jgi:hypothetical protein
MLYLNLISLTPLKRTGTHYQYTRFHLRARYDLEGKFLRSPQFVRRIWIAHPDARYPADLPLSRPHQRDVALQTQISQVTALYGLIMAIMPDDLHQGISKIPAFGDRVVLPPFAVLLAFSCRVEAPTSL